MQVTGIVLFSIMVLSVMFYWIRSLRQKPTDKASLASLKKDQYRMSEERYVDHIWEERKPYVMEQRLYETKRKIVLG